MSSFRNIDLRLCHRCGTCVSACPKGSISIIDGGFPKLIGECDECGLCFQSCPGIEFTYPKFNKNIFGVDNVDDTIGCYKSIHIGHSKNEEIRTKGASGGVVTALLLGLLKRGKIKAAIVAGMDDEKPWVSKAKIVTRENDILDASQSKYCMISMNAVLKNINNFDGDLAYVGLPCHIHGIRKLQKLGWEPIQKIKYLVGIFCSFSMENEATSFLISKLKIAEKDIRSLEYRGGPWPGGFRVKTKDGKEYFIDKQTYNYLHLLFAPKRCFVCPDLTNEFADVSVGDAWHKDIDSKACSTIIARTENGRQLLKESSENNDIEVEEINKAKFNESHGHLIAYKKRGFFIRHKWLSPKPYFGLSLNYKDTKKLFNVPFFLMILLLNNRAMRAVFSFIPIKLPGAIGRGARSLTKLIFGKQR